MKRLFILLAFYSFAILSFSQNIDDCGNEIKLEGSISNKDTHLKLKSIKSTNLTIIKTIPSPTNSTNDIAFDGENIWQASNDNLIYKISPVDGALLKTIPVNTNYASGLTFDGNSLWVSDRTNQLLLKIDTLDGTVQQQFSLNNDGASGLAWTNSNLWHNNNKQPGTNYIGDTTLYISSISGVILDYFLPQGPQPTGLAFDGTYLWSSDNYYDRIYKIDLTSYLIMTEFDAPGGAYPNGLAFDGQYLWIANNESDSIYQVDVGLIPTSISNSTELFAKIISYPNPSSGSFTFKSISNNNISIFSINIYNTNSQLVLRKSFEEGGSSVINSYELNSGLYSDNITNNGKLMDIGKLVKE